MKISLQLLVFGLFLSVHVFSAERAERDLSPFSGTYTFNFTDTDESATVTVHFRRSKKADKSLTSWLADGKMEDRSRRLAVTFSGAYVVAKENGDVVVDAQFVRFKLIGKRLEWLPGYEHKLFKE